MPRDLSRPPTCTKRRHERPIACDCCSCSICFACHELMPCMMHEPFFRDQLNPEGDRLQADGGAPESIAARCAACATGAHDNCDRKIPFATGPSCCCTPRVAAKPEVIG